MTTRRALCNVKGLSEAKVEKIKEAAGKLLVMFIFWKRYTESHQGLKSRICPSPLVIKMMVGSFCLLQINGFQTASEYRMKRKQVFHITTGSLEFE